MAHIPRRRQGKLGELSAQFTARGAVHPMQAMLNFSIGVIAARMARVVAAHGLDAAFGFLHDGRKPGRLSLVWDCVELHRPKLVETFEYAAARVFRKNDFRMIDGGIVRLTPPIMKEVAALTINRRTVSTSGEPKSPLSELNSLPAYPVGQG